MGGLKNAVSLRPFAWRAKAGMHLVCVVIPQEINRIKEKTVPSAQR